MSHSVPLISTTRSATAAGPLARAAALVTSSLARLVREVRVQRALHQIEGLDDRLLADIVGHGQSESAVRHGRDGLASTGFGPTYAPARIDLGRGWTEWR